MMDRRAGTTWGSSLRWSAHLSLVLTAMVLPARGLAGQAPVRVEVEGVPRVRIVIEDAVPRTDVLTVEQQREFVMRIVERGGRYFWASREMTEMSRSESGVYVIYTALNGSGFVKIYALHMRRMGEQLPEQDRRREIRYIEQVSLGFTTFTYVGYFGGGA